MKITSPCSRLEIRKVRKPSVSLGVSKCYRVRRSRIRVACDDMELLRRASVTFPLEGPCTSRQVKLHVFDDGFVEAHGCAAASGAVGGVAIAATIGAGSPTYASPIIIL